MQVCINSTGSNVVFKPGLLVLALLLMTLVSSPFGVTNSAESAAPHERLVISTTGDNFSLISLRQFGTTAYGWLIAEYNQLPYETVLVAGQILRIPISPASDAEFASVVFAKGESQVMVRGNRQELRDISTGDRIYAGDIVKTSQTGFISLRFPSGSIVNVRPDSLVQLLALDCLAVRESCVIALDARTGGITSNVVPRPGQPTEFKVRTPHASAAVRGTIFDIDASSERMLLGVTEGIVDVTAQGRSTDVHEGLGIKTLAGQPSSPPVRLLAGPNFRRAPTRTTEQDTLAWFPLDDADQYILSVASDSEGSTLLYSLETSGLTHQMRSLPAGDYFARLRAVDVDGFKGFVSQLPIIIAGIDTDAFLPVLSPGLENGQVLLTVPGLPDNITEYEVQLSFREDFLELSSVDVPVDGGIQVAPAEVITYFRARVIIDPSTVGLFGPVLSIPAQ